MFAYKLHLRLVFSDVKKIYENSRFVVSELVVIKICIWNLQAHKDPEQLVPAGQAEQGPPFLYIDFPIQFPPKKKKKNLESFQN